MLPLHCAELQRKYPMLPPRSPTWLGMLRSYPRHIQDRALQRQLGRLRLLASGPAWLARFPRNRDIGDTRGRNLQARDHLVRRGTLAHIVCIRTRSVEPNLCYRIYEMRGQKAARLLNLRCNASLLGRVLALAHHGMVVSRRMDEPVPRLHRS